MSQKLDLGWLYHLIGGAAIQRLAWLEAEHCHAPFWLVVLVLCAVSVGLTIFGLARELWQHRDDRPRMTGHRWVEALAWPVGGSLVAGGVVMFS